MVITLLYRMQCDDIVSLKVSLTEVPSLPPCLQISGIVQQGGLVPDDLILEVRRGHTNVECGWASHEWGTLRTGLL